MTVIDKISFRFSMADEPFARGFYADWERFCQQCVIDIMDEFFTRYDSRNTYIGIDRLHLDLGGIPQKDFYDEFPLRLRNALERTALPYLHVSGLQGALLPENAEIRRMQAFAQEKRVENLLHYLQYGFCLPEWTGIGFDPEEELMLLDDRKTRERLLASIIENPNVSERFFARAHDELPAAVLSMLRSSPVLGHAAGQITVQEALSKEIETALDIQTAEASLERAAEPDYIEVPNAGLCLLALWLPRLFDMLGLLETNADGKKELKDTEARIRAIFILQRLVTDEQREYKEQALAFNRILAGCPFHVPLPKTLELTENEIQTAESMLAGAKANWSKLENTSIKGFRRSFIERPGRLEQREDKWVLYVDERAYDILLDSLPWSYRRIQLPWLKKKMNVVWRDKEEYDFEKLQNHKSISL